MSVKITVILDDELHQRVKHGLIDKKTTISKVVRQALEEFASDTEKTKERPPVTRIQPLTVQRPLSTDKKSKNRHRNRN